MFLGDGEVGGSGVRAGAEGIAGGFLRRGVGFDNGGCADGVDSGGAGEDGGDLYGGDCGEGEEEGRGDGCFCARCGSEGGR